MSKPLPGFIAARGELDRMKRANQIFFHVYTILTFFAPFFLVTFRGEPNAFLRITWQIAFILLLMGLPLLGKESARLILWGIPTAALIVSAVASLILRPSQGTHALPLTLITLSVVLYTSSTFGRWKAHFWIGIVLLAEVTLLKYGGEWFAARGAIVHGIPVVIIFHTSVGVLISEALNRSRIQAGTLDNALAELVSVKFSLDDISARESERRVRLQGIHGDVLNTLIGLASWTGVVTSRLVESCLRAISMSADATPPEGGSLRGLVAESLRKIDTRDFKIRLSASEDVVLSQSSFLAVRAIIEECVSNAVRHSQGTLISIGWRIVGSNQVEIWIEDDGVGIAENFLPRLGWSEVIVPALRRLNGRVERQNRPGSGVRISFTFLYSGAVGVETSSIDALRDTFEKQDVFQDHALSWAAQLIAIILVLLTPIYLWSESNWHVSAAIAALLGLYLLIFLRFPQLHTFSTNLGAVLSACGFLVAAAKGMPGCSNSASLQWIANIIGTTFLAGVYRFGLKTIFIQFPLFVLSAGYVASRLDSACIQVVSIPLYGAGIYGIVSTLHSVANKRRRRAGQDALARFTELTTLEEIRLEQRVRDENRWQEILEETKLIFIQVVEGEYLDPDTRKSAILQDARLRAHLQIEALDQPRIFGVTGRLIDRITNQGIIPTLQIGTFSEETIQASEADFVGPQEVVELLVADLEKFRESALLYVERRSVNVFVARISGETKSEMNGDFTLGFWKYKSTTLGNGQGCIELMVSLTPLG